MSKTKHREAYARRATPAAITAPSIESATGTVSRPPRPTRAIGLGGRRSPGDDAREQHEDLDDHQQGGERFRDQADAPVEQAQKAPAWRAPLANPPAASRSPRSCQGPEYSCSRFRASLAILAADIGVVAGLRPASGGSFCRLVVLIAMLLSSAPGADRGRAWRDRRAWSRPDWVARYFSASFLQVGWQAGPRRAG